MNLTEIVIAVIGLIGILLPSYWVYLEKTKSKARNYRIAQLEGQLKKSSKEREEAEVRTLVVERLLDISLLSEIREAVNYIFEETKAERFLILIAVNGKIDFNVISVIFEQHKGDLAINAVARYKNISIDDYYKEMLKKAERVGVVHLHVDTMPERSLLSNIYKHEGVKHSEVRHLMRQAIDSENDVIVYSSIGTFQTKPFTLTEKAIFLTQYDSVIVPALRQMIDNKRL